MKLCFYILEELKVQDFHVSEKQGLGTLFLLKTRL